MVELTKSSEVTNDYFKTLTVGSRVVVGKGICDCGASVIEHPSVVVETILAHNFNMLVTDSGVHSSETGKSLTKDGTFVGILNPETSLDAEYALCEDSLNFSIHGLETLNEESDAKDFLELEVIRLNCKLDDLVEKVMSRL